MTIHYGPGAYKARVIDYGFTKAKTNNSMFFMQFQILKKVSAEGITQECESFQRKYFKALTDNTIAYFHDDLQAIGVKFDKPSQLDPQIEGAINLIGREITVYCTHVDYQGEKREQWDLRHLGITKMSADDIRKLDDLFSLPSKKPAAQTPVRRNNSAEPI